MITRRNGNIKQHYVPQFYLKNFSDNDQLYVFNIPDKVTYISNIKDIGCQRFFYDTDARILPAFIEENVSDEQFVDNKIRTYNEDLCAPIIKSFESISEVFMEVNNIDGIHVDDRTFDIIIDFILLQFVRTPKFRNHFDKLARIVYEIMSNYSLPFKHDVEYWKQFNHNMFIYGVLSICESGSDIKLSDMYLEVNGEMLNYIKKFKEQLICSGRSFLISNQTKYFMTSDNPVSIQWNENLFDDFKFVYLPINKSLGCIFYNKEYFPQLKDYDRKVYIISQRNSDVLDNFNLFVTDKAESRLYSYYDDFEKITKFINGEIKLKLEFY